MGIGLPNEEIDSVKGEIRYKSDDGKRSCIIISNSCSPVMVLLYDCDSMVMRLTGDFEYSNDYFLGITGGTQLYLFLELFLERGIRDASIIRICHNLGLIFHVREYCEDIIDKWGFECKNDITNVWFYFNKNLSMHCSLLENTVFMEHKMFSSNFTYELLFEKFQTLANMTGEALFDFVADWQFDLPIEGKRIDNIGTEIFCLDHKGVKVYMYPCIYDILHSSKYLLKIDYLKTGSILKLDGETGRILSKAKVLGLKAFIWGFNENATPKMILLDDKGEFKK